MNGSSPESAVEPSTNSEQARTRRAYKACLHCRARKAKCDLGDIDAPGQPPCARCRRERRECIFAPSFRGGKIPKRSSTTGPNASVVEGAISTDSVGKTLDGLEKGSKNSVAPSLSTFSTSDLDLDNDVERGACSSTDERPRKAMRLDSPDPDLERSGGDGEASGDSEERIERLDPQSLAAASLRNPTDALNLLALAADVDRASKGKGKGKGKNKRRGSRGMLEQDEEEASLENNVPNANGSTNGLGLIGTEGREHPMNGLTVASNNQTHGHHRPHAQHRLSSYRLVKTGVVTPAELMHLTNLFFSRVHIVFPMMPHYRIPKNEVDLAKFAKEENYLITAIVVITSRQEKMFDVHEKSWQYMQTLINEIILGKVASVSAVEALLLLSENLPRRSEPASEDEEHRMSWMLVGMAVRLGYMLGLDQKTLRPMSPSGDRAHGDKNREVMSESERLDREVLAWTYCYIFDRSISIRSGKAFWSRGPGLCFQRTYSSSMPNSSDTFPSLKPIPGIQDDFASMLQAYTELTQTMASAHDVLYPSKDRTIALVRVGDYHKYLDEFTRSINGFRLNWEGKVWETSVVTECVWLSFHYLRLYIYAFAFQAHVQRSTSTSHDGKQIADTVIFPRGPMGSPDARFILEAIDAATCLLRIAVDKLHPSGRMASLPWRFFLYFSYAGVFLLKAVFVGAVVPQDQRDIVQLIKKVILCLAHASSDDQHYGIRYARLLNGLLRVFSRGVDGVASQVNSPKRHVLSDLPLVKKDDSDREMSTLHPMAPPTGNISDGARPKLNGNASRTNGVNGTNNVNHDPHTNGMDIDSQRQVRHLPSPINTSLEGPAHPPPGNGYYHSPRHRMHPTSAHPHSPSQAQVFSPEGSTPHGFPHPQQHQQRQMYAQRSQGTTSSNGYPGGGSSGFEVFQPGYQFQFDLNWPPMEPDGLAQMLSDDHSLDGDFWMSLPNHAQWQTWPVGTTPTNPLS